MKTADILQTMKTMHNQLHGPEFAVDRRRLERAVQIVSQDDERRRRLKAELARVREALNDLEQALIVTDVEDLPPAEKVSADEKWELRNREIDRLPFLCPDYRMSFPAHRLRIQTNGQDFRVQYRGWFLWHLADAAESWEHAQHIVGLLMRRDEVEPQAPWRTVDRRFGRRYGPPRPDPRTNPGF